MDSDNQRELGETSIPLPPSGGVIRKKPSRINMRVLGLFVLGMLIGGAAVTLVLSYREGFDEGADVHVRNAKTLEEGERGALSEVGEGALEEGEDKTIGIIDESLGEEVNVVADSETKASSSDQVRSKQGVPQIGQPGAKALKSEKNVDARKTLSPDPELTLPPMKIVKVGKFVDSEKRTPSSKSGAPEILHYRAENARHFEKLDFLVVPRLTEKRPDTVILFMDQLRQPEKALRSAEWSQFASKYQFGLVSIGLKVRAGSSLRRDVAGELSAALDDLMAQTFGGDKKLLVHSVGGGAEWFLSMLQERSESVVFWSARGAATYPVVQRGVNTSPGIVVTTSPSQLAAGRGYFEDLRRTSKEARQTFIASDQETISTEFLNRFFRQYATAVLDRKIDGKGQWFNLISENRVSEPGFSTSWVPNEQLGGAWQILNLPSYPPRKREVTTHPLKVTLKGLSPINLYLRVPHRVATKKVMPRQVLFKMTWNPEEEEMPNQIGNMLDPVVQYCEQNNIPIIAWNAHNLWKEAKSQSDKSVDSKAVKAADTVFEAIRGELAEGVRKLCVEHGWSDRNWLLNAELQGGRYGLNLLQKFPDRFSAAHFHGASGLNVESFSEAPKIPVLVTIGWEDPSTQPTTAFSRRVWRNKWPVLFKRFPELGHATRWDVQYLEAEFFNYLSWIQRDELKPWVLGLQKSGALPARATVGDLFALQMRRAPMVGDWHTLNVKHTQYIETWDVPSDRRVKLPHLKMAEAWAVTAAPMPKPLALKEEVIDSKGDSSVKKGVKRE